MWTDVDRPALDAGALRRALVAPAGPYAALDVVAELPSTNSALADAARAGAPDRTVLVAEHQTAGRGRAARSWVSAPRAGLAVSVLLRPVAVPQPHWGWLPLLAGVALCRAVTALAAVPVALKWPNDLLLGQGRRKAAGILGEVVEGPAVVLGIGLNVSQRADELPPTAPGALPATSLALESAACTDRDALLRALLEELDAAVRAWTDRGGDPEAAGLRAAYRDWCATLGARVRVELPGGRGLVGTAEDIDAQGRLVVAESGRRTVLSAGDITHLRT